MSTLGRPGATQYVVPGCNVATHIRVATAKVLTAKIGCSYYRLIGLGRHMPINVMLQLCRYYGESLPFGASSFTKENLAWLTMEQVRKGEGYSWGEVLACALVMAQAAHRVRRMPRCVARGAGMPR